MTPALQLDFYSTLWRPLVTTDQAAWMLDECTERHVLDLLDEGKLRGVNIAAKDETRRLIRVWRYSISHRLMPKLAKQPFPEVSVEHVLTHQRATVLRREMAYWLSCSEQHVSNLNLPGPRDTSDSRHLIYRAAVIEFLTTRTL